jgi:hypothetical protein
MSGLRKSLKKIAKSSGAAGINRLWARWQLARNISKLPSPVTQDIAYEATQEFDEPLLLTAKTGVFHYEPGRLRRILEGDFYGLSQFEGRWYLSYRMTDLVSQIISFGLRDGQAFDVRCEFPFLHPGIHQIDFCDDRLLVADTTMNRMARYRCQPQLQERGVAFAYPNGRVWRGRESPNYVHINSVFSDGETTLLMFHNQASVTGRNSEIVCLDRNMKVQGRRTIDARCAHNVVVVDDQIGYCDSQDGSFVLGDVRLSLGSFTRGVAVARDQLFVGGSDFSPRANRQNSNGLLYCLTRDGSTLISKMHMPAVGGVYEVRLPGGEDQSLSEWARRQRIARQLRLEDLFEQLPARNSVKQVTSAV